MLIMPLEFWFFMCQQRLYIYCVPVSAVGVWAAQSISMHRSIPEVVGMMGTQGEGGKGYQIE